ncbi:lysylphosphatidylglycerol synthase domain-containing protein [Pararhodobacter sp.]|uniref:lysylphosphatidylglycerol synthase domain-containing protein n=1 Tax=Pararhodobacter sp. TaxID=2127056 RepID=UPI002AFFB32A|nr:lysylphosphatidylglycerol synthase domain-containing protein [Pararhodobacter sp.]
MISAKTPALRHILPILLGIGLFGLGLYALFHLMHSVDPTAIMAQIKATPPGVLMLAVAATTVGYAALVGYDALGLRFVGKTLPNRIVALGGFLGYAFGNTVGISVISGGAIRYRIYAAFGLSAFDVATISGYIAAALGVGLTLVGLAALSIYPNVVAGLVPFAETTIRLCALGIVLVAGSGIAILSVKHRRLKVWRFDLHLPSPGNLAAQMAIVLVDVVAASFALWVLMPVGTPNFGAFIAIYAIAMMIGVLSHVPGGIGVFETIVLGTLPLSVPVSDAAAALVLFRVIYYLLPFGVGVVVVSLNEARLAGGLMGRRFGRISATSRPAVEALHGLAPAVAALLAFGFGVYLILVSLLPSIRNEALEDGDFIAALLIEGGTLLSALIGAVLLVLSQGLARQVRAAFLLTLLSLCLGALAAVLNDFDWASAGLLLGGAVVLWPFAGGFTKRARLTEGVFSAAWFALVFALGIAATAFFFFLHQTTPYSNDLWTEIAHGANTPRALRAGLLASGFLLIFAIFIGLQGAKREIDSWAFPSTRSCRRSNPWGCWVTGSLPRRRCLKRISSPGSLSPARWWSRRAVSSCSAGCSISLTSCGSWRLARSLAERPVTGPGVWQNPSCTVRDA